MGSTIRFAPMNRRGVFFLHVTSLFIFIWSTLNSLGKHTTVWGLHFYVIWFLEYWIPWRAAALGGLFILSWADLFFMLSVTFFVLEKARIQ